MAGEEQLHVTRTLPGFNVWTVSAAAGPVGFVHVKADGTFVGFRAALNAVDGTVVAIDGVPSPSASGATG